MIWILAGQIYEWRGMNSNAKKHRFGMYKWNDSRYFGKELTLGIGTWNWQVYDN